MSATLVSMHILFISMLETLPWAGSESQWVPAAAALLEMGHGVSFSFRHGADKPQAIEALEQKGARPHYRCWPAQESVGLRIRRRVTWEVLRRTRFKAFSHRHWLLSLVMESDPDLVVLNQCNAYEAVHLYEPLRAIHEQGIPYFLLSQLEGDEMMLLQPKRDKLRFLYEHAIGSAYGSRAGAELIERQLALTLPKVVIFQNPPNCSCRELPWPDSGGVLRLACVGRLDILAKGQDRILAALAGENWRARQWHLSFYGVGPDDKYLHDLAAHYAISEKVAFHGYVQDVDSIWAQEQVCLQPSPKEGTPMSVVEAMYAGRPCIVANTGRMPDLVESGVSGWVVERSVSALEQALDLAWDQRDALPAMGKAARRFITDCWDPEYPHSFARELVSLTTTRPHRVGRETHA